MLTRTVAAAAAAALLAGCGGTAAVETVEPLTPDPAADADSNKSLRTQVDSTPATEYVNVTGTVAPTIAGRWGATPRPGIKLRWRDAAGVPDMCTLGPAARGADGRAGFLTAGHCAEEDPRVYLQPTAGGGADFFGVVADRENSLDGDSAVVWTGTLPAGADHLADGRFPIRGVMPLAEVQTLPPGTPICMDSTVSGVVCGGFIGLDENWVQFRDRGQGGDSGSAVFVVDETGSARLLGVYSGRPLRGSTTSIATHLDPILDRLQAEAVTAR